MNTGHHILLVNICINSIDDNPFLSCDTEICLQKMSFEALLMTVNKQKFKTKSRNNLNVNQEKDS